MSIVTGRRLDYFFKKIKNEVFALKSIYGDKTLNMGRKTGTSVGAGSFAFGYNVTASGYVSHAEGHYTEASGESSHAEGFGTTANGNYSHAEGYGTTVSGDYSHAEGCFSSASGNYSHAEGLGMAGGRNSHAEGFNAEANGDNSHAEGLGTEADNLASHACGKYNTAMVTGGTSDNTVGTAFVIGNGTDFHARSNAFSVMYNGTVKAKSTITASTTADYAEFFEWADGNPDNEDRVGKFVTLDGTKIRFASENDDYILGIVSGEPFVLGNGDCDVWNGMHLRDEFGRVIYEPAPKTEELIDEETGEITYKEVLDENGNPVYQGTRPVLNPDYDAKQPYISRFDRPEWAPVGMLGVLSVYDDGTCEVNGYCKCNSNGEATKSENGYRVIERVADHIVKIILLAPSGITACANRTCSFCRKTDAGPDDKQPECMTDQSFQTA
ncbi:MAG: hypothetical protein K2L07_16710 [Lachnospiraceae bacterium]|nr:hypothetical protein [Lachnospiraceae bacterium]